MNSWPNWAYLFSPLMALAVIGLFILILRWAFGRGTSLVERPPTTGEPDEYGLLNVVAVPGNFIEGELIRQRLAESGVKATLAMTNDGPRVMVWPDDETRARRVLAQPAG